MNRKIRSDANGEATGRLWRFDTRLRALLDEDATDISVLCRTLHRYGVIGVTDATPDLDNGAITLLAKAPLDLVLLGAPDDAGLPDGMRAGPRKLLLRDHDLPGLDELAASIRHEHDGGRPVAVHCVTRESLVLTVLALERVGTVDGDRIEHAAVVVPDMVPRLADLRVAVVTQPSLIWLRGDDYVRDVAADDVNCLYPYASLLAAGMSVAPSSDAPYGDLDPWRTIVAARARSTSGDAVVAPEERVSAVTALRGFLSPLLDPGGPPRQVTCGAAADLCLLDAPLSEALAEPDAGHVRLVLHQGEVVFAA